MIGPPSVNCKFATWLSNWLKNCCTWPRKIGSDVRTFMPGYRKSQLQNFPHLNLNQFNFFTKLPGQTSKVPFTTNIWAWPEDDEEVLFLGDAQKLADVEQPRIVEVLVAEVEQTLFRLVQIPRHVTLEFLESILWGKNPGAELIIYVSMAFSPAALIFLSLSLQYSGSTLK